MCMCTSPSHWFVLEEEAGMATVWVLERRHCLRGVLLHHSLGGRDGRGHCLDVVAVVITAWVDGEAMVDTAWEEVMTVMGAETVCVLVGEAADVQVRAEQLVEVGLGDPDGDWKVLTDPVERLATAWEVMDKVEEWKRLGKHL